MRTRSITLALLAGLAWVAPGRADELRGIIVRVDLNRKEVQVEGRGLGNRGLALTVTFDKDTRVYFGRDAGALADVKPGKRVRLLFDRQGNAPRARALHLFGSPPARTTETLPRPDANTVAGVLQRVSYAEREVVVVGRGPKGMETETTVAVPKGVRVVEDGKVIPFDDLKDGRQAMIQTEKRDGKLLAKSIQVGAAAAAAESGGRIGRLRRLLKVADRVLEMVEGMPDRDPPK